MPIFYQETNRIMKTKSNNSNSTVMRIILAIYAFIYGAMIVLPLFSVEQSTESGDLRLEQITVTLAFLIYLTGLIYCWFNERFGGTILLIWHFIVWCFSLLLWTDAGMVLLLIFPVIFPAVILIRNWHIKNNPEYEPVTKQWALSLRILNYNYTAIYLLCAGSAILPSLLEQTLPTRVDDLVVWSWTSTLGLSLIGLLIFYLVGFYFSFRNLVVAGSIYSLWYLGVIILSNAYPEFANSGPSNVFGMAILIQAIMYFTLNKKRVKLGV